MRFVCKGQGQALLAFRQNAIDRHILRSSPEDPVFATTQNRQSCTAKFSENIRSVIATLFYCPDCRKELSADINVCPDCGTNIRTFWNETDYVDKLINALGHPEPTTPIRAASILGQLQDDRAVEPLINLLEGSRDIYIACAAVEALGHFPTDHVLKLLQEVADRHPVLMVKEAAAMQVSNMVCSLHESASAPAMDSHTLSRIATHR